MSVLWIFLLPLVPFAWVLIKQFPRHQLVLEMSERMAALLRRLAWKKGTNEADILRRSVALYKFSIDETRESNRQLCIVGSDGQILQYIEIP